MLDFKIKQLDKDIANKIAAGEVVERPLAVVKELVENAIDAGSSKITVEVKDAGKSLIRITDNGRGIEADDMLLAFERHATSKIRTINDIYNIASLGFRGEALASIASVSNIEMISKHKACDHGVKLVLEGGKIVERQDVGAPQGTTILVKDLFHNTPARLKFLKSNKAEQNAINDIMNKLALSHPEISFKYIVGGHNIFMSPGKGKMYDVIVNLYERNIWKHLLEVKTRQNDILVEGFISTTDLTRGNKQYQIVFVNNRFVKSRIVEEAINLAYRTMIPHNRFAIAFLNIVIDPSLIDINIHPSKTEIRFHQEGHVKDLIYSGLMQMLNKRNMTPVKSLDLKPVAKKLDNRRALDDLPPLASRPVDTLEGPTSPYVKPRVALVKEATQAPKKPFVKDNDKAEKIQIYKDTLSSLQAPEDQPQERASKQVAFKKAPMFVERVYEEPKPLFEAREETIYDNLTYVGQIFNTYLIFEKHKIMYLMDQHAGHEKVLFEQYVEAYKNESISAQMILEPITLEMNYMQFQQVQDHEDIFKRLGFQMEPFGEHTMVVREIPTIFPLKAAEAMIRDLIERLDTKLPEEGYELVVNDLMQQSCKHAIKGHDVLKPLEVKALIQQLKTLKEPYTCPHGRPIIIAMDQKELEKKFNRI